jgi:biopolymer transport protein ExbD
MAFNNIHRSGASQPLAEINMIPLIDVMLVLLVIFIVSAPLLTHAVKIDLPKATSAPNLTQPDNVQLAIRDTGEVLWNGTTVTRDELIERFAAAAATVPQPELHLRADRLTAYEHVARVMADAARRGITRLGFVSEPDTGGDTR